MTRIPDFHEEMNRFQNHIPTWVGHNLNRLRGKRAIWVRVLTGIALIVAWGFLPLPVVGIWMLPVGLALLAHDIPTVRAPIARLLHFTNRKIEKRKNCAMSALPRKADVAERDRHVC
jgi:ABC-type uncharacterized transport system permease subunit